MYPYPVSLSEDTVSLFVGACKGNFPPGPDASHAVWEVYGFASGKLADYPPKMEAGAAAMTAEEAIACVESCKPGMHAEAGKIPWDKIPWAKLGQFALTILSQYFKFPLPPLPTP